MTIVHCKFKKIYKEYSAIFLVAMMSETLRKRWNSGPSSPSSKKKKYMCKYQDDWAKAHLVTVHLGLKWLIVHFVLQI